MYPIVTTRINTKDIVVANKITKDIKWNHKKYSSDIAKEKKRNKGQMR